MNLSELEFHDARLLALSQDVVAKQVDIRVAYYPRPNSRDRVEATLRFTGVRSLQQLADFDLLALHANFGNVTQVVLGETANTTHLVLARGLIVVVADHVTLEPNEP